MYPVGCQDASFFIPRIVGAAVCLKASAQIHQRQSIGGCIFSDPVTVMIKIAILCVAVVVALADDGRCGEDDPDAGRLQFLYNRLIESAKLVVVGAGTGTRLVPYIIDT